MNNLKEKTKTDLKVKENKIKGLINYKLAIIVLSFVLIPNTYVYASGLDFAIFDNLINIILGILKAVGAIVFIISGVKLFESFQNDNPAGKTQGFMGMMGGIAIASMGLILDAIGIFS